MLNGFNMAAGKLEGALKRCIAQCKIFCVDVDKYPAGSITASHMAIFANIFMIFNMIYMHLT